MLRRRCGRDVRQRREESGARARAGGGAAHGARATGRDGGGLRGRRDWGVDDAWRAEGGGGGVFARGCGAGDLACEGREEGVVGDR